MAYHPDQERDAYETSEDMGGRTRRDSRITGEIEQIEKMTRLTREALERLRQELEPLIRRDDRAVRPEKDSRVNPSPRPDRRENGPVSPLYERLSSIREFANSNHIFIMELTDLLDL